MWFRFELYSLPVPLQLTLQVLANALKFCLNLWSCPSFSFQVCGKERTKDGIPSSRVRCPGRISKESQDMWQFLNQVWPWGMSHVHTKATEKPGQLVAWRLHSSSRTMLVVSKFLFLLLGKKYCLRKRRNRNIPAGLGPFCPVCP